MRKRLLVLAMLLCSITSASAQVSVDIGLPGVSIGINLPVYPQLVAVPGYPVYYAPQVNSNYFFYDGLYWVYQRDNWYASSWYNGPWELVAPAAVPLFVLRVPVRYYRRPPAYFHGWRSDAPPRWGEHWGNSWAQNHSGWDNWNRSSVPAPAPLPVYQRQYSGTRYPRPEQQQVLQSQNYRYQPQDAVVQQPYQVQRSAPPPTPRQDPRANARTSPPQQGASSASRVPVPPVVTSSTNVQANPPAPRPSQAPAPATAPHEQQANKAPRQNQKPAPDKAPPQQASSAAQHPNQAPSHATAPHDQQAPRSQGQDRGPQGKGPQESKQHPDKDKGEQQGGERNK